MSEKKTGKRLLSWVLVLIMALSLLPLNVLADEVSETPTGEEDFFESEEGTLDESDENDFLLSVEPTADTYSITFDANGGTFADGGTKTTASYSNKKERVLSNAPDAPSRESAGGIVYTFDGWSYKTKYLGWKYDLNDSTTVETILDAKDKTVTAKWKKTKVAEQASFYYVKDPTSNPASNETTEWGDSPLGNGLVGNLSSLQWVANKNAFIYNAPGHIAAWPTGVGTPSSDNNSITLDRNTPAWTELYNAFRVKYTEITSETDVDAIILHPYKISKDNRTTPDWHVDCTVELKSKAVFTAIWFIQEPGKELDDTWFDSQTHLHTGDSVSPKSYNETIEVAGVAYKFDGWYLKPDFSGDKVTMPYTIGTDNVEFYGRYVRDTYNLTINYVFENGNTAATAHSENLSSGSNYQVSSPIIPGYTANLTTVSGTLDKDTEITVTYSKDDSQWFTVEYKVNGNGSIKDGETSKYEDVLKGTAWNSTKAPETVAEVGYKFNGWDKNPEKITENTVITGTFVKDDSQWFTVTFNSNGGSTVASQTVKYNDKAKEPTAPTKSGYTFAGWYTEEQLTTKYVFDTPVTGNITLYAKWNTNYVPYYPPVPPTVKIEDDDALGLNTTDHFAYIIGYGNGEVRPQNNITRAEVATIFFRLLTDDVRDENLTKTNRYSDVAATSWYNTAVSTLSSMGIITGYPDGTFRPNAAITRAEFAAIAARFDNDGDKTAAKFSDIATHWAKDEISIAYNNGWITGYPDGTFGPQRDITRAETMTLVNRVLNRQPETEDDLLPNMTVWTDNANPKAWYYLAVQEATNSHYYKFKTNSKYEKWTELRETRDWTQLEK